MSTFDDEHDPYEHDEPGECCDVCGEEYATSGEPWELGTCRCARDQAATEFGFEDDNEREGIH